MYYQLYEMSHAAVGPLRAVADTARLFFSNPINPAAHTTFGKQMAAGAELFERMTRRYGKPEFGITETSVGGIHVAVRQKTVWQRPFCDLLHFERMLPNSQARGPKILIVAPMSGHYATLLRGTVAEFIQFGDVYVTDWADARMVPLERGPFRSRRLYRLRHLDAAFHRRRHPRGGGMPALGAGARGGGADGGQGRRAGAASHDADGRADRHPQQPDRRQPARRNARHRMVPRKRRHGGAVSASGLHARGLSGLPAVVRLHGHESRPPHRRPPGLLRASGSRRRRFGRKAPRILRRISGGHGPRRRHSTCRRSRRCSCATPCRRAR